jgi:hypothetical protein
MDNLYATYNKEVSTSSNKCNVILIIRTAVAVPHEVRVVLLSEFTSWKILLNKAT